MQYRLWMSFLWLLHLNCKFASKTRFTLTHLRACPIVEAMLTLADHYLRQRGQNGR